MDASTPLWKAHDISQQLQDKLEELPNVERAFVHVDHETTHAPVCWPSLAFSGDSNSGVGASQDGVIYGCFLDVSQMFSMLLDSIGLVEYKDDRCASHNPNYQIQPKAGQKAGPINPDSCESNQEAPQYER